ncbi:MAG: hypothetical protein HRT88_15380 [Lentisphaeraceae bacterium]|nr:hypothetical protein [Lentisphaeraceae bacterium]
MPIDINKEEVYQTIEKGVDVALKEFRREYLPSRILVDLIDTWPEEGVELFLASYPETPSILLERLAYTCKKAKVLCAVASHPRTSAKVMQDLAAHDESEVRIMLAANKQISPQTAALLSEDDSIWVRALLAANPALPTRIMHHLTTDPAPMVRAVFADYKNIDRELLNKLLMDPDHLVKARTALMAKVTDEQILAWADSDEFYAQLFLLCRKNLPPKVLESLCFSGHEEIQKLAINLKVLAEDEQLGWAKSASIEIRKTVAGKEGITPKVQLALCEDDEVEVLETLAANVCLCEDAQKVLAEKTKVAATLLLRENLSESALDNICHSCNEELAYELAFKEPLSDYQAGELARRFGIEMIYVLARKNLFTRQLSREKVVELVNSRIPTLVAFALRSACLQSSELMKFASHPCSAVRRTLLHNENINIEVLSLLSRDDDQSVATAASDLMQEQQIKEKAVLLKNTEHIRVSGKKDLSESDSLPAVPQDVQPESTGLLKKIIKKVIRNPKKGDE